LDLYKGSVDPNFANQTHDYNPGLSSTGVVWTIAAPGDSLAVDGRNGAASARFSNLAMLNHHTIPNVLQGDARAPVPGAVSFELRFQTVPKPFTVTDAQARGYAGEFNEASALLAWSAKQDDFQFTSDRIESSSSLFAMMGHERNGVYAAPAAAAVVRLSDAGFDPPDVRVAAGGTVTWTNDGQAVHSLKEAVGSGLGLNSGGLGRGQSYQFTFTRPGTYPYISEVDCLNGNRTPGFGCAYATVTVS
jgi:plastocyanin